MEGCSMMHDEDLCVLWILCAHIFYRIIHCTWVYPVEEFAPFFGYYFFNVMLLVLQMLHFYWAVLISRMLYKFIFSKVCLKVFHSVFIMWRKEMYGKYTNSKLLSFWVTLIFYFFSVAHLRPAAGRWWPEWWRGRWQWLTAGKKPQTESHKWLWSQRPGQWPLTQTDRNSEDGQQIHGHIQSGLQLLYNCI